MTRIEVYSASSAFGMVDGVTKLMAQANRDSARPTTATITFTTVPPGTSVRALEVLLLEDQDEVGGEEQDVCHQVDDDGERDGGEEADVSAATAEGEHGGPDRDDDPLHHHEVDGHVVLVDLAHGRRQEALLRRHVHAARRSDDPRAHLGHDADGEHDGEHLGQPHQAAAEVRQQAREGLDHAGTEGQLLLWDDRRYRQAADGVEDDGDDDEHEHRERVVPAGIHHLVDVTRAGLDPHVREDERHEHHEGRHLAEVRDRIAPGEVDVDLAAGRHVESSQHEQRDARDEDASDEPDLGDAGGVLRSAELAEGERPEDHQDPDELDPRDRVEGVPVEHIGEGAEDEVDHRDESDGDLEPLEEDRGEAPPLTQGGRHPLEDPALLPALDGGHLRRA